MSDPAEYFPDNTSQNIMDLQTALVPGTPTLVPAQPLGHDGEFQPSFVIGDEFVTQSLCQPQLTELDERSGTQNIIIGICAMAKKSKSKPMLAILERLSRFEYLETLIFEEEVILNSPIEEWPLCEVFISFHSSGFLLDKAIEYVNLRKPIVVNDLQMQFVLQDRRDVFKILQRENIAQPRYAILDRDSENYSECQFVENEDCIEIAGDVFHKPFVEKPVSAEDHNINIYFPASAGGGCQKLFRKVESRSSVYSSDSRVRRTGSYIYEEFMQTDGTDVKVYTVGPDYVHAEARKSPALDGKVERDRNGKEVRYPVILSSKEKMIARKVSLAFKQTVCGFDLLRANGMSYVCDVNGFSFVKTSSKYYDDCAKVLGTMIMRALAPQLHIPWVLGAAPEDVPVVPTTSGSMMELRCVIAVIRHGDRTPKQKMKMEVRHSKFFQLFQRLGGYRTGELKIKRPKQLQEILDIARYLLRQNEISKNSLVEENKFKLEHLKLVLEMYGHFSGINRKVQLKYQQHGNQNRSSSEDEEPPKPPTLLLIVKWGGELTPAGRTQAQDLGKAFRSLYPGGQGEYGSPGLGILRLHSTYRHDLKIYASDEGRVQMTAAAFTKGFLALEGELPPILVQMVKCANTNGLLDSDGETTKYQQVVKEKLKNFLNSDQDFKSEEHGQLNPTKGISLQNALETIKNPRKTCDEIYEMIKELAETVRNNTAQVDRTADCELYNGETWELLLRRWAKLEKDFLTKSGTYDISKIPDVYDCIKYDLQHNQQPLNFAKAEQLFTLSKALADIVIPQEYGMITLDEELHMYSPASLQISVAQDEYGITLDEKLHIAQSYCTPLLRKIHGDLQQVMSQDEGDETTRLDSRYSRGIATPHRFVRTRLYFTSESHIHSLLTMLRYGDFLDENKDSQWKKALDFISGTAELNYMTQIVIMMYEDGSKTGPDRFHVELHFSPGAHNYATQPSLKDIHSRTGKNWMYNQSDKIHGLVIPRMQWNVKPYRPMVALSNKQLSPHRYTSSNTSPLPLRGSLTDNSDWNWDFGEENENKPATDAVVPPEQETAHQTGQCTCSQRIVNKNRQFVIHTISSEQGKSLSTGDLRKKTVLEEPEWRLPGRCEKCDLQKSDHRVGIIREESNSGLDTNMDPETEKENMKNDEINQIQDKSDYDSVKHYMRRCSEPVLGDSVHKTDCFKVRCSCEYKNLYGMDLCGERNKNYTTSSRDCVKDCEDLLRSYVVHRSHASCNVDVDKSSSIISCAASTKGGAQTTETKTSQLSDDSLNSTPIYCAGTKGGAQTTETKTSPLSDDCLNSAGTKGGAQTTETKTSQLSDDCLNSFICAGTKGGAQTTETKTSQLSDDCLNSAGTKGGAQTTETKTSQLSDDCLNSLICAGTKGGAQTTETKTSQLSDDCLNSAPISIKRDIKNEVSRSQSWEEKHSQSLKKAKSTGEFTSTTADKHYLTVQLPLLDAWSRFSYANIIALTNRPSDQPNSRRPVSKKEAGGRLKQMLTMVPYMQALETLHNSLTLQHMSSFLSNVTRKKFVTPLSTPPAHTMSPIGSASPLLLTVNPLEIREKGNSFSSSTNSSAGPSTPTMASEYSTEDIAARLQLLMSQDITET